jgi:transcriptional regulator with XRE-family HTH domain
MRTVGSRRLVAELKRLREAAGLTGEQVAEEMGWSAAKVYRIEGDRVRVLPRDVQRLLRLYRIEGGQKDAVLELARLARLKDWWHQYSGVIPEWFQFYVGLEAAASTMAEYNAELVTGLLQTEAYARAVLDAALRAGNGEAERQVEVRMHRQKRLMAPDAPSLWAVMSEAVIRRQVGGPQVLREQLAHIAEVAALPNVTVQVLPFAAGAHPAMLGPFTLLRFPDPADRDVVYLEAETGALYLERPDDVSRYSLIFDHVRAQALGPAESVALIGRLAREAWLMGGRSRKGEALEMESGGAAWRTSSYSGGNGGQCIEVAALPGTGRPGGLCAVRDSKDRGGPVLAFGPGPWREFTAAVRAGRFGPA